VIGSVAGKSSLHIDPERCHLCRKCLAQKVCKTRAIVRFDREDAPFIDVHRCYGCLVCMTECPFQAVLTI